MFRFKTLDEFQYTTGIRIEQPKRYYDLNCLDDLKKVYIQKKRIQLHISMSQQTDDIIDINSIQVNISDIEMNTLDCFIDFLKGILRMDKEFRWTPSMALEHPFITRKMFTGHFEPKREEEKNSTNETGEDTMSE